MSTVVITLTDKNYFNKAIRTIQDIRSVGQYWGDLVLITIDFIPPTNFVDFYRLIVKTYAQLDVSTLLSKIREYPFTGGDGRELTKVAQWNKLYCFDSYFKKWEQALFFDAGFRIFGNLTNFIKLDYKNHILAMDDAHPEGVKRFDCQLEKVANPIALVDLKILIPDVLEQKYFLNCVFIYDTNIIDNDSLNTLITLMNRFPICRTNEMGIMNIYFNFILHRWKPLELRISDDLMLMDWTERDGKTWRNYIGLKYPSSIGFDCL